MSQSTPTTTAPVEYTCVFTRSTRLRNKFTVTLYVCCAAVPLLRRPQCHLCMAYNDTLDVLDKLHPRIRRARFKKMLTPTCRVHTSSQVFDACLLADVLHLYRVVQGPALVQIENQCNAMARQCTTRYYKQYLPSKRKFQALRKGFKAPPTTTCAAATPSTSHADPKGYATTFSSSSTNSSLSATPQSSKRDETLRHYLIRRLGITNPCSADLESIQSQYLARCSSPKPTYNEQGEMLITFMRKDILDCVLFNQYSH